MRVVWWTVAATLVACRSENKLDDLEGDPAADGTTADSGDTDCSPTREVCDGVDNDCDGEIDEGLAQIWYADADGDGWGDPDSVVEQCSEPDDHVNEGGDCDDENDAVHPGAVETCNDRDDDCDDEVDEDLAVATWYADADGDGWGDPDAPIDACAQPVGTTDVLADCDDADPGRHHCRSCAEVLRRGLSTGDGDYPLNTDGCGDASFFCDMTTDGGGWTELVDQSYDVDACPGDWQLEDIGFAQVCARSATSASEIIRTATIAACGIAWQDARGNATLYQYGSTDAFGDLPSEAIDEAYGDVVSITAGSPRDHVFTYAFGFKAGGTDDSNCPAIGGAAPPAFVGADFLCATGNPSASTNERIWYDAPLFSADWFHGSLAAPVTDDLEVRLIGTHVTTDEDMGVATLRLQVR